MKKIFDNLRRCFAAEDQHTLALRTLELKADASRHEINRSYRQLISKHHPDRGGDRETFINIRQAYEALR